ncbi:uncharacterized protein C8Q71DRAFT_863183 [Rhodofomes roseus]|uniref:CxC2-like cysteine cluster KDZ transposase-associated domain-containing protein n=1 Tax=Rhodofomes roseus TaxID=34475 RepID=A0ABQ8JZC6_9APHY|nr:uncharacterized protein C8Q71DRAFT_863183 [Rhodofomes roseus]KAH9829608.1 hypothetical protein C8Q71DRAFT_863183 [Rhodofomes roseus]
MGKGKRKKTNDDVWVDPGVERIPNGPPTILMDEHGKETIHYWSPHRRREKRPTKSMDAGSATLPSLYESMGNEPPRPMEGEAGLDGFLPEVVANVGVQPAQKANPLPHSITATFVERWAQKLLDIFRSRETDPDIGTPCYNKPGHDPVDRPLQLWGAGLWPASFSRPQTAFTVHVLGFFSHLTFQAKTTAHDFYGTLRRITSNAFFEDVKDRYREFMTAHRQFNYVHTLKRFAFDVKKKLEAGCLALRCPACPHPDVNMDPNWRERPEKDRYKDALHYAKDGNFHLSQHDKKMDHADVPLMDGAAYYVHSDAYRDYLEKMNVYEGAQEETTTCSNFNALSDSYKGKIKTGQVGLSCTRHGFVLPCGTVDLHIGERYANVDYATLSGLQWFHSLHLLISSYDVNCKYGIHWWTRLEKIASLVPSVPGVTLAKEIWPAIRRCVPKWHLASHKGLCQWLFSFYYTPGVGNTDGESVERRWAVLNAIGRSVREMGPGHRQDVIDAHNSDFNAQKMFKIARHLQAKLKDAQTNSAKHRLQLDDLEATHRLNKSPLDEWKKEEAVYIAHIVNGDFDSQKMKNPYQPAADEVPTAQDVLAELKKKDAVQREKRLKLTGSKRKASALDDTAAGPPRRRGLGDLFVAAFDLERQQEALKEKVREHKKEPSSELYNRIEKERDALEGKLKDWSIWQEREMGAILTTMEDELDESVWPSSTAINPEEAAMLVPSSYPPVVREHPSFERFVSVERRLREAHAHDILRKVRQKLHYEAFYRSQNAGAFGQQARTRYTKLKATERTKIEVLRKEYEYVRVKAASLAPLGEPCELKALSDKDCMPPVIAEEKTGRRKETVSWIWRDKTFHGPALEKWALEAARVEWCRASARVARWGEEVEIVQEEMRRVQRFFKHWMEVWDVRAKVPCATLAQRGAAAYAAKQAAMYSRLLLNARALFPVAEHIQLPTPLLSPLSVSVADAVDNDGERNVVVPATDHLDVDEDVTMHDL